MAVNVGTTGTAGDAATTGGAPGQAVVSVETVRRPAAAQNGLVTVLVPAEVLQANAPFSFRLPAEVGDGSSEPPRVTLMNFRPLPDWLQFDPVERTFKGSSESARQLPINVLVRVGTQRWTVTVSAGTKP